MTTDIITLLLLWTACEATGQILFKRGVDALESDAPFNLGALLLALRSPLIWGGVAIHVVEFVLWIEILGRLPLSAAFPLESISYVVVVTASRLCLAERVSTRRWIGVGLICIGIAILGTAS